MLLNCITHVFSFPDNGYFMGDRGLAGKWLHYNEALHIPLIIYDPRLPENQRGREVSDLVSTLDLAPTFLDLAGVAAPTGYEGQSLMPLVQGEAFSPPREALYLEHLLNLGDALPKWRGVRTGRYSYANYFEQTPPREFLHDLQNDPDQLVNLAEQAESKGVLEEMRKLTKGFPWIKRDE